MLQADLERIQKNVRQDRLIMSQELFKNCVQMALTQTIDRRGKKNIKYLRFRHPDAEAHLRI